MPWLIDGNNLLGAMGVDRHGDEAKRALVRSLASFARAKRTRVTCVFDGPEPAAFARNLGSVLVVFGAGRSADDVIAERAAIGRGWSVVTNDRGLATRVKRREVQIVGPASFVTQLEGAATGAEPGEEDWDAYFSDPENRLKF